MSIDLLLDEQGGWDVSALLLQPMLERDKGCQAALAVRLGTDLPSDPDEPGHLHSVEKAKASLGRRPVPDWR